MTDEEKRPNLKDKSWQKTNELGEVPTVFHYITKGGTKESVDAIGMIPPGPTVDQIEEKNSHRDSKGINKLDGFQYGRDITCLVLNLTGAELQVIMENKGPDLYNQMRNFAFKICGLSLSDDETEKQKN